MALIIGLAFFLNLFAGSLLQTLHFRWGLLASQILFIAGPVLFAVRWFYLDRKAILPFRLPTGTATGAAVLGALGLYHILTLLQIWQQELLPKPPVFRPLLDNLLTYRGPLDFALVLILAGGVVPLCEEVFFRGFLQSGLTQVFESAPKGVVTSSLIFAIFHLDPWRFSATLLLGIFLGALVANCGSLLPAILAHAMNNVMAIAVGTLQLGSAELQESVWTLAVSILFVALAGLLLVRSASRRDDGRVI